MTDERVTVLHGDCRDALATLQDASVDACVTDPPYALVSMARPRPDLAGKNNAYARRQAKMRGFMGHDWDTGAVAFDPDTWREVLRVLKPGGHCLAFGSDRTFHRLACAIEDAGFEIRGTLLYLYGSGFPKSHNVSKKLTDSLPVDARLSCAHCDWQIIRDSQCDCPSCRGCDGEQPRRPSDGAQGAPPLSGDALEHIHADQRPDGRAVTQANSAFGAESVRPSIEDFLAQASRQLKDSPAADSEQSDKPSSTSSDEATAGHKTAPNIQDKSHSDDDLASSSTCKVSEGRYRNLPQCPRCGKIGIPGGLGTALKPAAEFIVMARKPLGEKTVAANVQAYGTGALNIDGCRIEGLKPEIVAIDSEARNNPILHTRSGTRTGKMSSTGRWPANVTHDGSAEVLAGFPETQSGQPLNRLHIDPGRNVASGASAGGEYFHSGFGDSGSAARFFYTSKADADDRLGSKHPTVKPVDLMAWLCRLVTPAGGLVLDPFAGSGTTGMACLREGFRAILIEREAAYVEDIRRRLAHVRGADAPLFAETAR